MEKGEGSNVANLIVLVMKSNQPLCSIAGGGRSDNGFKIQNWTPQTRLENYTLNSSHLICEFKIENHQTWKFNTIDWTLSTRLVNRKFKIEKQKIENQRCLPVTRLVNQKIKFEKQK